MAWYNPFSWGSGSGNTRRQGYQNENPSGVQNLAASVTFDSAMTVSAFWASVRLLSEVIGSMPLKCYKIEADGTKIEHQDYPLCRLLNFQPNRYQTRAEFFETIMLQLVTSGNAYVQIQRSPRGVVGLVPLMSAQMQVRLTQGGDVEYIYTDFSSERKPIPAANVWHIKLFGNTIVGMSPLGYAAQQLGVAIATENRVSKLAKNGGKQAGVLMIDNVLSDQQRPVIRANMESLASGDSDGLKILEANMKWQPIGLSPQDMQLLESRRFNIEDIARFMGVPSVLINDTQGSTVWGSGIEQILSGFYKLNLSPYAGRIESSLVRHLMPMSDWGKYEVVFDFDQLTRADRKTRIDSNSKAVNSGQMTPNEARRDIGLGKKENGDDIYLNGTLVKAGQAGAPNTTLEESNNENN